MSRLITTLTLSIDESQAHIRSGLATDTNGFLLNVVPPKSLSTGLSEDAPVRKDSAVYVSLSSYSLVKQHDGDNPSFGHSGFPEPAMQARHSPERIFSLADCKQREPRTVASPCGAAVLVLGLYSGGPGPVSTPSETNCRLKSKCFDFRRHGCHRRLISAKNTADSNDLGGGAPCRSLPGAATRPDTGLVRGTRSADDGV